MDPESRRCEARLVTVAIDSLSQRQRASVTLISSLIHLASFDGLFDCAIGFTKVPTVREAAIVSQFVDFAKTDDRLIRRL